MDRTGDVYLRVELGLLDYITYWGLVDLLYRIWRFSWWGSDLAQTWPEPSGPGPVRSEPRTVYTRLQWQNYEVVKVKVAMGPNTLTRYSTFKLLCRVNAAEYNERICQWKKYLIVNPRVHSHWVEHRSTSRKTSLLSHYTPLVAGVWILQKFHGQAQGLSNKAMEKKKKRVWICQ